MKNCPACHKAYSDETEFCPRDGTRLDAHASGTNAQPDLGLTRRFHIVRKLGAGGMGAVFLAEQIAVGHRPVALKVLLRKLLDDPDFLQRFEEEAGSTGRIDHPNVVTIHESGQSDDGTPYIAMEYLEGETLRHTLKAHGALPVTECAEILQQTARGLNAAHRMGIIHRDLKPDNIFLTRGDEGELVVKVVDFGIAKLRESATHTLTGTVLGTPAYMSYEQASGMKSEELDERSDVYSLGIVTYEMLTGRLPFQSDTPVGYLRKHLMEQPPQFRSVAPGLPVPPQVEAVVMKALTKDRDQRYGSALEFAREFTRAASVPAASEAFPTTKAVGFPDKAQAEVVRQAKVKAESERLAHAKVGRERLVLEEPKTKRGGPERSQVTPQHPTRAKYVALSLVGLAVIIAAIWYFSPSGSKQKTQGPTTAKSTEEEPESAIPQPALAAVAARVNPKDGLKYVWIPPGTFMMGCSPADMQCKKEEKPSHQVTITKGFWMGQTPVTVGAYKRFTGATGRQMPPEPEDLNFLNQTEVRFKFNPGWSNEAMPIVELWWDDAQAYCRWAGGRLPTEAEWEYAGRGGSTEARYGNIDDIAWYGGNSGRERPDSTGTSKEDYTAQWLGTLIPMHEVAKKRANGFGLYDMLGNGNEWVNDWYDENYYQNSPLQDPAGPSSGYFRVLRGGDRRTPAWLVRVSTRWHDSQTTHYMSGGGFRCGREVINP